MSPEFIERERRELFKVSALDKYMAGHSGFIAGGCIKNIFRNEHVKDIDIFFSSEGEFLKAQRYFESNDTYKKHYDNAKVLTFRELRTKQIVELIKTTYGTPEEIISKFDFSITKFAYYKEINDESITYKIIHHKDFFEHLHLKKLVLNREILFPVSTFERTLRYTSYGYGLCRESKINLLSAIRNTSDADLVSRNLYFGID